jgi:hypothetical protein
MMRKVITYTILMTLSFYSCSSQEKETKVHFLGEVAPGDSAILFAPNKLDHPEGYHSSLIIANDYKEVFFSPMTRYGEIHKIVDFENSLASEKLIFPTLCDAGDPILSPDNKRLYFLSFQPIEKDSLYRERIWYSEIVDGKLNKPKVVDKKVYDHPTHWQFSVASNYNLYFTSEIESEDNQDIYLSQYLNGRYQEPIKLPVEINTGYKELCPYISPSENYLIFARSDNTTEKSDLFISYKKNKKWTKAERLPNSINSKGNDLCPVITPDKRYLFFISTREGTSKIYWVNANFLHE